MISFFRSINELMAISNSKDILNNKQEECDKIYYVKGHNINDINYEKLVIYTIFFNLLLVIQILSLDQLETTILYS